MESFVKSYWTTPSVSEKGAPQKRIIHGKYFKFQNVQKKFQIGFQEGQGYFKCGSEPVVKDWVEDVQIFAWIRGKWKCIREFTGMERPGKNTRWITIEEPTKAIFLSIRKSGVDGWWPCYSLAYTAFVLEGVQEECTIVPMRNLHTVRENVNPCALQEKGIRYTKTSVMARYETRYYSIGFQLKKIGLQFLGCDGEGKGDVRQNLLHRASIMNIGSLMSSLEEDCYQTQGFVLANIDEDEDCGLRAYNLCGETELNENTLIYHATHDTTGQEVFLKFTMEEKYISVEIKRVCKQDVTLFDSGIFRMTTSSKVAAMTTLGAPNREGETGGITLPATVCFPGYGNIVISGTGASLRFNSIRAYFVNNLDIQVGEKEAENGCYLLEKGVYEAKLKWMFQSDKLVTFKEHTPEIILRATEKYLLGSLPYRADVDKFTNNGNSIGCSMCLDLWADLCDTIGDIKNGVHTWEYLKHTVEMHLLGAPTYTSGMHTSGSHRYEDEYIMTGVSVLYGVAKYLKHTKDQNWFIQYRDMILTEFDQLRARDIDDDGLIESVIRKGISGEHQWSTCWYDVISFGYKDAFSNAVLYAGLKICKVVFGRLGETKYEKKTDEWIRKIKKTYRNTFMTENGWLAGWKSMDQQLHDYGFLQVNGVAAYSGLIEKSEARIVLEKLYDTLLEQGFDSFDLGLPGNIFPISRNDLASKQINLPFGGYQNAGITFSQSRHFINGLYAVGMEKQADMILYEICRGLLYNEVVSGTESGMDWRTWDGTPSGYEGILCDQFGVFEPLLKRYKKNSTENRNNQI